MPHPDDETLSLIALGETATSPVSEHVRTCSTCEAQVVQLRSVVDQARSLGDVAGLPDGCDVTDGSGAQLVAPPDHVWAAIAAATGVQVHPSPQEVRRVAATVPVEDLISEPPRVLPSTAGAATPAVPVPVVGPQRGRHRRRTTTGVMFAMAASLVIGLLGGAGGVFAAQRWGAPAETAAAPSTVVGTATLTALPEAPAAAGSVDVVQTAFGKKVAVTVRRLPPPEGYYEVWLADESLGTMVSIGLLHGDSGTYDLPDGIDPALLPTVDISAEPLDGDPRHSTTSVLRGTLQG